MAEERCMRCMVLEYELAQLNHGVNNNHFLIPQNEQGVIVFFAQQSALYDFRIISIGTAFPDAVVVHDGKEYKVEFEYAALNFHIHQHDPRECDLIICWENNWPDAPLPVLALSEAGWAKTDLAYPDAKERERYARMAEERIKRPRFGVLDPQTIGKFLIEYLDGMDVSSYDERHRNFAVQSLKEIERLAGIEISSSDDLVRVLDWDVLD